ncbi:MAG: hypothetical protein NVSMB33_08070 [Ktedonobacteraceae bacterium]
MEYTKRAVERSEKISKKLPPEVILWIKNRAEELAKADLLSSAVRMKHINEAYEQWKQEQQIGPDDELDHEQEDGVWLGKKAYCVLMQPNARVLLTHERSKMKVTFTAEEAYDLFQFLKSHKDELHQKVQ